MGTTPATTTIRSANAADHAAIADLLARGYDGFDPTTPYFSYVTSPAEWVPDATRVFVAVDADDVPRGVVAFALAGTPLHEPVVPPMGDASFRFLAVAPEARGRGIGRDLVAACLEEARAAGCRRVAIFTMEFMTAAQHLYPRLGFRRRPDLDVRFPGGYGRALVRDLVADAAEHFTAPGEVPAEPPWYEDVFALDHRRTDRPG